MSDDKLPTRKHVVVAGAGIAGLTAALILARAGLRVTLIEAAPEAGGKAKSLRRIDGHPTEHSLRIYLDHYQTLLTLLNTIPFSGGQSVLENLMGVSPIRITSNGIIGRIAPPTSLPSERPPNLMRELLRAAAGPLLQLFNIAKRSILVTLGLARRGVPPLETIRYIYDHFRLLWMCRQRVHAELGNVSYQDYLKFERRTPQARAFFAALPRIFVAAQPTAEAASIAPVILKALFHFKCSPRALRHRRLPSTMMMNGPTSERMIEPWIEHLKSLGVDIRFNTQISELRIRDGKIAALVTSTNQEIACDFAILAVPYLVLKQIAARHLPHLAKPQCIQLESSNGLQCFLRDIPTTWPSFLRPGILASYLESEWSLISVLQGEGFWKNVKLPEGTRYVLSITWSEVEKPGRLFNKTWTECSPEEVLAECLAQCRLDSASLVAWQIDDQLRYMGQAEYEKLESSLPPHLSYSAPGARRIVNLSPLTILMPGAREASPQVVTEVDNLFLAGEAAYSPDLTLFVPTMEKASSAGYLAAMSIVRAAAPARASTVEIEFEDPYPYRVLRKIDAWRWRRRSASRQPASASRTATVSGQGNLTS